MIINPEEFPPDYFVECAEYLPSLVCEIKSQPGHSRKVRLGQPNKISEFMQVQLMDGTVTEARYCCFTYVNAKEHRCWIDGNGTRLYNCVDRWRPITNISADKLVGTLTKQGEWSPRHQHALQTAFAEGATPWRELLEWVLDCTGFDIETVDYYPDESRTYRAALNALGQRKAIFEMAREKGGEWD